jgi:ligand-binding sensor protein
MSLLRILPVEAWVEIERALHEQFGMNTGVYNASGARITTFANWANRLCPVVKAHPEGVKFICAVANQAVTEKAVKAGAPVVEECDAGLVKICLPLFEGDRFLGTLGGCGLRPNEEPLDLYYLQKIMGVPMAELEDLAGSVPVTSEARTREFIERATSLITERTPLRIGCPAAVTA